MLGRLRDYFFPRPIRSAAELRRFASGEAAYLAQRSTYEFSRNTLAWYGQSAFAEKGFNRAFAKCRWEAFAAILADMLLLSRNHITASHPDRHDAADEALLAIYRTALEEYPRPEHRPEGWEDAVLRLQQRLQLSGTGEDSDARRIAVAAASTIFTHLPVYSQDREENLRVITSAVTFGMISFADRMRQRLQPDILLQDIRGS